VLFIEIFINIWNEGWMHLGIQRKFDFFCSSKGFEMRFFRWEYKINEIQMDVDWMDG
jgi:hypothetical protein